MRRSDRQFDPFTESVIDGMVAASVVVKVFIMSVQIEVPQRVWLILSNNILLSIACLTLEKF